MINIFGPRSASPLRPDTSADEALARQVAEEEGYVVPPVTEERHDFIPIFVPNLEASSSAPTGAGTEPPVVLPPSSPMVGPSPSVVTSSPPPHNIQAESPPRQSTPAASPQQSPRTDQDQPAFAPVITHRVDELSITELLAKLGQKIEKKFENNMEEEVVTLKTKVQFHSHSVEHIRQQQNAERTQGVISPPALLQAVRDEIKKAGQAIKFEQSMQNTRAELKME